jgi:tetratricopeptide (TPR) repeat protein
LTRAPEPRPAGRDHLLEAKRAVEKGDAWQALDIIRDRLALSAPLGDEWALVTKLCAELDDDDAALAAARRLWNEAPRTSSTAFVLARALESTGHAAEAVSILLPGVQAGKLTAAELFQLSRMLMYAGRRDHALALTRRLLRDEPGNPFYWSRVAQLKEFGSADPDLASLERLVAATASAPPRPRAAAAWALSKAFVDLGDDAQAARMLDVAAAARREVVTIDPAAFAASAQASLGARPPDETPRGAANTGRLPRVLFVLGPQRSGTTLVEQILSRHPAIAGGGELKFMGVLRHGLGDFTYQPIQACIDRLHREHADLDPWGEIRRRYLALGDDRFGAGAAFVDKLLTNHLRLAVILRAFPDAPVIRVRRDPLDIAWSNWRAQFDWAAAWNSDPEWIARYVTAYEWLLDRWAARVPGMFIDVSYEALVADPDAEIPRLLAACGLPDDVATRKPELSTRAVMTSSFAEVRAPIHAGRIGAAAGFPIATAGLRAAFAREAEARRPRTLV